MRLEKPEYIYALFLILPLLGLFLGWSWRVRQKLITQFVQARLLPSLTVGVSHRRQKVRLGLLAGSVALMLIGLARPQWGYGFQEVKQRGLDIVVAIDTSRSMLAEDVVPNRLGKAKLAALDLRRLARADRLGLVAFAGTSFLQMPLSIDEDAFRQHLEALDTDILPQGGTAIAEAIQTTLSAFKEGGQDNHRALILFSDGEDHDGQAIEAAKKAAKDGLRIFTVGVGTPGGELIPVRDAKGRTDFIKDESGNAVKTRLNEGLLKDLAQAGNGFYVPLSGAKTMEMLYEQGLAPLPKTDIKSTMTRRYFERFQWFLAAALLVLLMEMLLPHRTLDSNPAPAPALPSMPASNPAVSSANASAISLLILFLGLSIGAIPSTASTFSAQRNYESGKFKNSLNDYEALLEKKPSDAPLHYNAGAAAYQAGNFKSAEKHFESSLATPDSSLQEKGYYNLGNTRYQLGEEAGDPTQSKNLWEKAISDYESALKLDPADPDAKHNLDIVKKKLEELKKQQQQQNQQNQKDQKKEDSKDSKDSKDQKQNSDNSSEQDSKNKDQNKKDSESKDSQSKQNSSSKEEDSKDPSSSEEKKKQEDEKKGQDSQSQESNPAKDQRDQEGKEASPASQASGDPNDPKNPNGQPGARRMMQMTKQEAIQLLEALRSDEKLLRPPPPPQSKKQPRGFKDW